MKDKELRKVLNDAGVFFYTNDGSAMYPAADLRSLQKRMIKLENTVQLLLNHLKLEVVKEHDKIVEEKNTN